MVIHLGMVEQYLLQVHIPMYTIQTLQIMLQKWMEVLSSGTVEKILQIMLLMVVYLQVMLLIHLKVLFKMLELLGVVELSIGLKDKNMELSEILNL